MIRPRVVDVGKVVAGIEEMLRRTIGATSNSLADDLWPVLVDPAPPEQPLVNLTVNAGDAMPSGGMRTIDTGNVTGDADSIAGRSRSREGKKLRLRDPADLTSISG